MHRRRVPPEEGIKKRRPAAPDGVPRKRFLDALAQNWPKTAIPIISNNAKKLEKTPDFVSKSGVFMANLSLMDTMHHVLKAWCINLWVRF